MSDPVRVFLFGTLLDPDLRRIVLGCDLPVAAATLPGRATRQSADGDWPVLGPGDGAGASGALTEPLAGEALARLDYYEAVFGYSRVPAVVTAGAAPVPAQVYAPDAAPDRPSGRPWCLSEWQARWGPLTRMAAQQVMARFGAESPAMMRAALPTIRIRADAALRAGRDRVPHSLRGGFGRGDVTVEARRYPYLDYFGVQEDDLRHTRFDGGTSARLTRAAFLMGDAVTVLPYDPGRDRVLLVEQFRYGPLARGDLNPWSLEPVAGRIDPGETPEQAAHRETAEETGLTLDRLIPISRYYPSPGAVTEYLFSFLGLCDLPDGAAISGGGKADEGEDIRTHVIPFGRMMELIATGEAGNGPLHLSAFWLASRRGDHGAFA